MRGEPIQTEAAAVTGNFFTLLGVSPAAGNLFSEANARAESPAVAVVSYGFWLQRLDGNPAALGQTITENDERHRRGHTQQDHAGV